MFLTHKRSGFILFIGLFLVLILSFSLMIDGVDAKAWGETFTIKTFADLETFLTRLEDGYYYADTITITGNSDIDCGEYVHTIINFNEIKDKYPEEAGVSIIFDVGLANIYNPEGEPINQEEHYGLFSNVKYAEKSKLAVYYKVTLDAGEGTAKSEIDYYRYSEEAKLPEVIAPEGKTFVGWREKGTESIVTKISATSWGVKSYEAVYELNSEGEGGGEVEPDEPENDDTTITYPIVYIDNLGGSGIDSLVTTYTVNEELVLGNLEKEGFDFVGWCSGETKVEKLNATLQDGLLGEDDKITLTAVWELKNPIVGALTPISKLYDGGNSILELPLEHSLLDSLNVTYKWYKKGCDGVFSEDKKLSFCDVHEGEYMVKALLTHQASGLNKEVASEYVKVQISSKVLSVKQLSGDFSLNKTYDTTAAFHGTINANEHFELQGVIAGDEVSIKNVVAEYSSSKAGAVELNVSFSELKGSDISNYVFDSCSLIYSTFISKKSVVLEKISSPDLSKDYDGTTNVEYEFKQGKDFNINGILEDVEVNLSCKYLDSNATTNARVELNVVLQNDNYIVENSTLNFDGVITPKDITLNKLSSPSIIKDYDGTDATDYNFQKGIDFDIVGLIEDIEISLSAKYSSSVANAATKIVLTINVLDSNYILEDNTLEFNAVISKRKITITKANTPNIAKVYDGTRVVDYKFNQGADYVINGVVDGEVKKVNYYSLYDNANISASNVVVLFGEIVFNDGASIDNYEYTAESIELYFNASITPKNVVVSGKNIVRTYEDKENLVDEIPTGVNDEKIKVRYIRETGNNVGQYKYVGVEAVLPIDTNYTLSFIASESIYEIVPSVPSIEFPTFNARVYDEHIALVDETLVDSERYTKNGDEYLYKYGVFKWTNPSDVACVANTTGYQMVFVPSDTINYDYTMVENYDATQNTITRFVVISISKATPVPTDIQDSFIMQIGMRYNKLQLPTGWSIAVDSEISSSSVASGEPDTSATFQNALVYEHDDSGNYQSIYKDLVVNFVLSEVVFVNGENQSTGNYVNVIRNLNDSITIRISLINPFEKEGYKVSEWTLEDGTRIFPSVVDTNTYDIVNADLIKAQIFVNVGIVARSDIKVEYRHYYENMSGGFDEENMDAVVKTGTADATIAISYDDLIAKQGFNFKKTTLLGGDQEIDSFVVSPRGDSIVAFYYERKSISISYIDSQYSGLPHEGSLPSSKVAKYGVPFDIDQPTSYLVYGYSFVGYTDGVTMENGALKKITDLEYTVSDDRDIVEFNLCLKAQTNTLYIINRHVGEECVTERHYGTTGTMVDITNLEYEGHKRYAHEMEKLNGLISGNVLDEEGNLLKGEILTLVVYYKVESFIVSMPEEFGSELVIVEYGKEVVLPSAPEVEGKEFVGWLINGVLYGANESITMPASDIVITAKWQSTNADTESDKVEEDNNQDSTDSNTSIEGSEDDSGLSSGAVIGIIAGAVGFVVVAGIISAIVAKRQKKHADLISKLQIVNRNMFKKH